MRLDKFWALLFSLVLVFSLIAVPGCTADTEDEPVDEPTTEEPAEPEVEYIDATTEMIAAAAAYLTNDPVPTISAEDLFNIVQADDPSYQIVSVRAPEHYEIGHINGAINIPFKQIWTEENLAKLDPNKTIVVVCYTGHTASEANMFYNMLGYDAITLKFGMSGWTTDEEVYALDPFPTGEAAGFDTVTDETEMTETYDLPTIDGDYEDVRDAIIAQAEAYFAAEIPFTISSADVKNTIIDTEDPNYQILSVRGAEDFAKGHLPGAINVGWKAMADEDMLSKLDPDKKTIVYCYTGHTGGEISMFLNLLGYESINMRSGMCGWSSDADVTATSCYDPGVVPDYETVTE